MNQDPVSAAADNSNPNDSPSDTPGESHAGGGTGSDQTSQAEQIQSLNHSDEKYVASSELPVSIETAFAYHERPGCLNRLIPPWQSVEIVSSDGSLKPGSRVTLKTRIAGVPVRWEARHTEYEPPHRFADVQDSGPFAAWHHEHRFVASNPPDTNSDSGEVDQSNRDVDAGTETAEMASATFGCRLTDSVDYRLPGGSVGKLFGRSMARRELETMFAYRHRVTRDDLQLVADYPVDPMTVAISGSNGLVGRSLSHLLTLLGHRVIPLVRSDRAGEDAIAAWGDPSEVEKFNGVDAVIHLAGKSIASGRWSESVKQEIRDSRVDMTRQLCERIAPISNPPSTLICASATGYYGDRGDEWLEETSSPGDDFLAEVAQEWESACDPARQASLRVVHARFGIIVSPQGGALQKMLFPAKCFGGKLGSGRQHWSWMALDDVLGGIVHALCTPDLSGAVNFVAPDPLTNTEFTQVLGRVLNRPPLLPAPATALRLALGEMADALLLASTRVRPTRLIESGYRFRFTDLEELLRYQLGRERLESVE